MADASIPELSPEELAAQRKEAKRLYNKAWRKAHPEYHARKERERRAADPEASRIYKRQRRAKDIAGERAKESARRRKARSANPERVRAQERHRREQAHQLTGKASTLPTQKWRERNKARIAVQARKNHQENAARIRAVQEAWKARNPEKVSAQYKVHKARRRALKAACPLDDFTPSQWRALCKAVGYRCCYCGEKFPSSKLTPDHLTPYVKQGSNTLHNILPCCVTCNSRKKDHSVLKPVQPFLLLDDSAAD